MMDPIQNDGEDSTATTSQVFLLTNDKKKTAHTHSPKHIQTLRWKHEKHLKRRRKHN